MRELASGKLLVDFPAEAVARIRISNPRRRNALDQEILDAIAEAMPSLDQGIETRCVLITGEPPVFSAGYDIASIPSATFERDAEALVAHPFHAALEAIVAHPWPTVAAINGHCLGGALELAISCDLRICAAAAQLGMPPARIGLVYGHTGLRKFLDTIGLARTKELFLTGRKIDAARAERIGLVNEVVGDEALEDRALSLAAAIAGNAPLSLRGNKSAIDVLSQNPVLNDAQEAGLIALRESCFSSEDFREGIAAFAEKRKPIWEGTVSLRDARAELAAADPVMAALIARLGPIDLSERLRRRREERPSDAYGALLRAIIGQQLSTKAARTIYGRVLDIFGGSTPTPEQLLGADQQSLREAGLSGRKVEYLRDLAAHVVSGELELARLGQLADEDAIAEIVAVRGLGRWTAEMFLLFHLERPDVLSAGDLGIRKAVQIEYELQLMPAPELVSEIGEAWRPHRSLASLYLWESLAALPA